MYENLLIPQNTILVKAGCFCREILFLLQDLVWIYQNMKQSFLRCVGALAKHICEADFGTLYKSSGGFMLLISEILICHWLFSIWNRFFFFFFLKRCETVFSGLFKLFCLFPHGAWECQWSQCSQAYLCAWVLSTRWKRETIFSFDTVAKMSFLSLL